MWELVKETEEYKCWICLDDMVFVNKRFVNKRCDWKNSIGRKIGFRCQYNKMPLQEKWFMIKDINKDKEIVFNNFDNNVKITNLLDELKGKVPKESMYYWENVVLSAYNYYAD